MAQSVIIPVAYDPQDRTHQQIHPEAYDIVCRNGGVIPTGRRDDRSPNFRGLSDAWWQSLHDNNPRDFVKLIQWGRKDFPTFCALFIKIVSRLDMQMHPFVFNNGQQAVWNKIVWCKQQMRMVYLIILKARQMGISCFCAADNFHELWRGENVRTLDATHDEALAVRIVGFFRGFYESLPKVYDRAGNLIRALRPKTRGDSKTGKIPKKELYFSETMCQGDTYVAKNLDPRGFTSRKISLHEPGFYPNLNDFMSALEPQLPALGTKARLQCSLILESTPNGQNDFFDFWEASKEEDSEMVGVFLPWYIHDDEYSLTPPKHWRMTREERELQAVLSLQRKKIDGRPVTREQMYWRHCKLINLKGDEDAFDMEYPSDDQSCFMLRSQSAFSEDMKYLTQCVLDAELNAQEAWSNFTDSQGNDIKTQGPIVGDLVFPPPPNPFSTQLGHISVPRPQFKPGSGDLWVWEPPRKGHVYFAGVDVAGGNEGRDYSVACVIDCTTGRQVAEYSGHLGPEYFGDMLVHLSRWFNHMMVMIEMNGHGSTVLKRMSTTWGFTNFAHEEKWDEIGVKKNKPGWYTNELNRPMIFNSLKYFTHERYIKFASRTLVREMSQMKKEGQDYRTSKKHQHDDHVVAAGLACIGIRQAPKILHVLESSRSNRIPTAVELGLSHNPAPAESEFGKLKNVLTQEQYDALTGLSYEIPVNPLRGVGFVEDLSW